ncbi:DUF6588 family protein [Pedobacter chitinilyticus]|uniref:Outer membrane protein beta-barrel domain-containing protein n=1 Tax=Pedobacter chitinilyticus TaxID=2233776 RepID=A0A443YZV9_9SPHI|nr:DUF6588 family protein [Pedobacter chitinilyticus]RWU09826.1 hypothetical protein DPV69_00320 [Pedobacter chitinilyticus]
MEKKFRALRNTIVLSAFLLPFNLMAQDEVGGVFKGTPADAGKLAGAYLLPATTGFGLGLNSMWYTSAKAKNFLRFDLRITASGAFVPSSDKTFDVTKLGLTSMAPVAGSNVNTPTIAGPEQDGTRMQVGNNPSKQFNLPEGIGVGLVPAPQVQLTVGLPKNIDVSVRYTPTIDLSDFGKVDLFGVGAKVEVLPLVLGKTGKMLPFDLAVAFGYTQLKWNIPLEVGQNPNPNQNIDVKLKGVSVDAIISKKIAMFTPFFSLGYNKSNTHIRALGTYSFDDTDPSQTYTNPFEIKRTDVSGMKASLGFQLHLAFFRLYGSYTQAKYGYVNAGIGFGIGN